MTYMNEYYLDGLCCWCTVYIKMGDRQTDRMRRKTDRQIDLI